MKDANERTVRVEIPSKCRVVTVERRFILENRDQQEGGEGAEDVMEMRTPSHHAARTPAYYP